VQFNNAADSLSISPPSLLSLLSLSLEARSLLLEVEAAKRERERG
jgi:hypothetical protein